VSQESTTPELVEATRRALEAFSRRDWDTAIAFYTPDAVWDMSELGLGVFEGHDALRGFFEDWLSAFEDFEQELVEFRELGDEVTLVVARQHARLAGSIGFVDLRYAAVVTWAGGLVERVTSYANSDQARSAAERLAQER
jgi:ketosteroid isomerase-like protein